MYILGGWIRNQHNVLIFRLFFEFIRARCTSTFELLCIRARCASTFELLETGLFCNQLRKDKLYHLSHYNLHLIQPNQILSVSILLYSGIQIISFIITQKEIHRYYLGSPGSRFFFLTTLHCSHWVWTRIKRKPSRPSNHFNPFSRIRLEKLLLCFVPGKFC